jgi:hypothetical protein
MMLRLSSGVVSFSNRLALRKPADATTGTGNRIGEVLRAFWEPHFTSPTAIWAANRIWWPYWHQELKIWMEFGPSKETHSPQTLLLYDLYVAGFIIVWNPYDLTIQAQSHEVVPIEKER